MKRIIISSTCLILVSGLAHHPLVSIAHLTIFLHWLLFYANMLGLCTSVSDHQSVTSSCQSLFGLPLIPVSFITPNPACLSILLLSILQMCPKKFPFPYLLHDVPTFHVQPSHLHTSAFVMLCCHLMSKILL